MPSKTLEALSKNLAIKAPESKWSHGDKLLYSSFIKNANDDILQTIQKQSAPDRVYKGYKYKKGDETPIVNELVDKPDLFRTLGLLGQGYLTDRWDKMDSGPQKTLEMLLANAVEASALNFSHEPFKVSYGFEF